jgi:glycine C-acetyltransferase
MEAILRERGERRRHERIRISLDVFSISTGRSIGMAVNLSPQGAFIQTENPLRPGTRLFLEFDLPDFLPIKAYCNVVWIKKVEGPESGPSGMGIQFINIYEYHRAKLEEYIRKNFSKIDSDDFDLADFIDISDRDIFKKTEPFWEFIEDTTKKGFNQYRLPVLSACKNRVRVSDKTTGREREMIMMGSCNYLGLSTHPKVLKATEEAIKKYGTGSEGAALLTGSYDIHRALEFKLARMKDCEDAVVFPTGYGANSGSISALVRKGDIAVIDRLAHASIIDGCMLSDGSFRTFKHSNIESLKRVLENVKDEYNGKLIVIDGVYSMDGDIAPLPHIIEIANQYGARVMVDEAHATGVIGERGRGTPSHFKVEGKVDIVMGTLSKALGSVGGFVASSKEVVNYLRYYARSGFFSINLPPAVAAAALAAIEVMESEPELHKNLWRNTKYMKENLRLLGFNIGNTESAIIPIIIGDNLTLRKMTKRIYEEGVYLNAIPYPAVPKGHERFRLSLMATHTKDDLDETLEIIEKVGREFGIIKKPISLGALGSGKYSVREVSSKREIEESVRFSWKVYRDYPAWVPYFIVKDQVRLISGDYFYFRKVSGKRFVVEEGGEIVGTVSAFVDSYFNRYHNRNVGFLGFFEALPNRAKAVELLLGSAMEFLELEGSKEIWAPVNGIFGLFGGGLLSSGFEKTPSFLQVYTPPYYHDYFTKSGFSPIKRLLHYTIDLTSPENVERIRAFSKEAWDGGFRIRKINKHSWDEEARYILGIYNEAFSRLWGNVPFDYDEFMEFANEFKTLITPDLWLMAEVDGNPVGFIGGFPQYAPVFRELNGEIKPLKMVKLPMKLRGINEGVIVLAGVSDKYRGRGIGRALFGRLAEAMIERGYFRAVASWALEDNLNSRRVIEGLGGEVDLYWTIYGRNLNSATGGPSIV